MTSGADDDYIDIIQKNFNDLGSPPPSFFLSPSSSAYSFLEVSHDGNGGLSTCVFFAPFDDDDYNSSGASVLLFTFPCANFYAHSCTPAGK